MWWLAPLPAKAWVLVPASRAPYTSTCATSPISISQSAFLGISAFLSEHGLSLAKDLIPVRPAAHYLMGGVQTDVHGRTSLKRLYAAGEVACTGVHGANRLASNSLLEGLVFGARAAAEMRDETTLSGKIEALPQLRPDAPRTNSSSNPQQPIWPQPFNTPCGIKRDCSATARVLKAQR